MKDETCTYRDGLAEVTISIKDVALVLFMAVHGDPEGGGTALSVLDAWNALTNTQRDGWIRAAKWHAEEMCGVKRINGLSTANAAIVQNAMLAPPDDPRRVVAELGINLTAESLRSL